MRHYAESNRQTLERLIELHEQNRIDNGQARAFTGAREAIPTKEHLHL